MFSQAAEEEAEDLAAEPAKEDEAGDESMDEAEGSLPSLGKRRSTDTALSGQTSKRARPGSLTEVLPHAPACTMRLCLETSSQSSQCSAFVALPVR